MDTKDPTLIYAIAKYIIAIVVSIWGGAVSYFEKQGNVFLWRTFFIHLSSASFAGLITLFLCEYANVPLPLIGVFCAVSGHMGTSALLKLKFFRQYLEK